MLKHAISVSLAMILVACTAEEEDMMDGDVPPTTITDPADTPPETPPETPPDTPPDPEPNSAPLIETEFLSGQEGIPLSATLQASDADGDAISFALVDGPKWLRISAAGEVTGTPGGANIGEDPITVSATDGTDTSEAEIDLEIIYDPIGQALRTGDYTIIVDETDLTPAEAMLEDFERIRALNNNDLETLVELGGNGQALAQSLTDLSWIPTNQAVFTEPVFGQSLPLVYLNTDLDGEALPAPFTIATIGQRHYTRFAVLGDNPFRQVALDETRVNSDLLTLMENTFDWLIEADLDDGFDIVIANMPETNAYPDQTTTRDWLTDTFEDSISYNDAGDCDGPELESCITDETDLIILSQHIPSTDMTAEVSSQVEQALLDGVPVLYLTGVQGVNTFGYEMLDLLNLGFAGRNTSQHQTVGFSPVGTLRDWQPGTASEIETLIDRIERDDIDYDLSICNHHWQCLENTDFAADITAPLERMRSALDVLHDQKGLAFPVSEGERWLGLGLLVGDHYRSQTTYPMSETDTPSVDIVRAMYGDLSFFVARDINPPASLGSFGTAEFANHLRGNKSVTLSPRRPFLTTGVYAIPGETVTVTRTDDSDLAVRLKVHSIREKANSPFRYTYERPLVLSSRLMTIAPGETLSFTSATGGPIHAYFATDEDDISLDFENVGEHPVWRGPDDSTAFLNEISLSDYDWVEFVTPNFEVHSQRSKILETFNRPYISSPSDLADMIDIYIRDWPHWLAGWEGPGISQNPDLRAFAEAHGLTIPILDTVKHMNADRPHCTLAVPRCAGTSGNPYDALWFFDPIYLGDLHELGHGLEFRSRHHFEGGNATHSTTNMYSHHRNYRYYSETGNSNFQWCGELPHEALYDIVQASQSSSDPGQYMRDTDLTSSGEQQAMFVQLFAALENQGVLDDGWQMMPRLNLVTREFQSANNDEKWADKADGLGFGGMDRTTAFSLSQNDWLLIALSWSAQRDLREYLEMWGYIYSDDTLDHVAGLNLPALDPAYYAIGSTGHCFGFDHDELPIDGHTSWPSSTAFSKVAAFTPDYLRFAGHEHDEMCSFGEPLSTSN